MLAEAAEAADGKGPPIDAAVIMSKYYGGSCSSEILPESATVKKLMEDIGTYKELRIKELGSTRPPRSMVELLLVLIPFLAIFECCLSTGCDNRQGCTMGEYVLKLVRIASECGEENALIYDITFRTRLSANARALMAQNETSQTRETYVKAVGTVMRGGFDAEAMAKAYATRNFQQKDSSWPRKQPTGQDHCRYTKENCRALANRRCLFPPSKHMVTAKAATDEGNKRQKKE